MPAPEIPPQRRQPDVGRARRWTTTDRGHGIERRLQLVVGAIRLTEPRRMRITRRGRFAQGSRSGDDADRRPAPAAVSARRAAAGRLPGRGDGAAGAGAIHGRRRVGAPRHRGHRRAGAADSGSAPRRDRDRRRQCRPPRHVPPSCARAGRIVRRGRPADDRRRRLHEPERSAWPAVCPGVRPVAHHAPERAARPSRRRTVPARTDSSGRPRGALRSAGSRCARRLHQRRRSGDRGAAEPGGHPRGGDLHRRRRDTGVRSLRDHPKQPGSPAARPAAAHRRAGGLAGHHPDGRLGRVTLGRESGGLAGAAVSRHVRRPGARLSADRGAQGGDPAVRGVPCRQPRTRPRTGGRRRGAVLQRGVRARPQPQ